MRERKVRGETVARESEEQGGVEYEATAGGEDGFCIRQFMPPLYQCALPLYQCMPPLY